MATDFAQVAPPVPRFGANTPVLVVLMIGLVDLIIFFGSSALGIALLLARDLERDGFSGPLGWLITVLAGATTLLAMGLWVELGFFLYFWPYQVLCMGLACVLGAAFVGIMLAIRLALGGSNPFEK